MEQIGILKVVFDTIEVSDKFKKRDFVLTIGEDTPYPQHIQFQLSQDKVYILNDINKYPLGAEVKVHFNLRGREHNGPQGIRYFNTIEAWKIEAISKGQSQQAPTEQTGDNPLL